LHQPDIFAMAESDAAKYPKVPSAAHMQNTLQFLFGD